MAVTDGELLERYPWGAIDHDNKAQWKGYLDRRLMINRCLDCGYWINPPRPMCPKCWSERVEPQEVSGRGKVQWFTLLFQFALGDDTPIPYPAVVVELDEQENLRLDSTVIGCMPEDISCDMALELTWTGSEDAPLPLFHPSAGPTSGQAAAASRDQ